MKIKNRKTIKWALLLVWMGFIFYMSHKTGDESTKQSGFVIYIFNFIGIDLNSYFGELATLIIRKGAHFTEYFILGILSYNVLKEYVDNKRAILYSIGIVFLYACSDEYHQSFIPGRAAAFTDVLIDTSGGICGSIIIYINNLMKRKRYGR